MERGLVGGLWFLVVLASAVVSQADIVVDMVSVGNPGNAPDSRYHAAAPGAVGYAYDIGQFEITAGQYCVFLNAVARSDTYELYNPGMWLHDRGCKIQQTSTPEGWAYSVEPDWANRPVNYITWGDAARFANWMHNGQPSGVQDSSTTEAGSYTLNGAVTDSVLLEVVREPGATWVLPSEDEWHKAAYHKNDGMTGNYYDYPTAHDDLPSNQVIDPDPGNNANFNQDGLSIGAPYTRSEVGEFEASASPYGTFDQGGNVYEWNEAVRGDGQYRGLLGGSWGSASWELHAMNREYIIGTPVPTHGSYHVGLRLALVPEPAAGLLLGFGLVLVRRRRLAL